MIILAFSFCEILVFNEEVLLALCFLVFIFYAYSTMGQSIQQSFDEIGSRFETSLLWSIFTQSLLNFTTFYCCFWLFTEQHKFSLALKCWKVCISDVFERNRFSWSNTFVSGVNDVLNTIVLFETNTTNALLNFSLSNAFFGALPKLVLKGKWKVSYSSNLLWVSTLTAAATTRLLFVCTHWTWGLTVLRRD